MNQPQATIATAESQADAANGHYTPCQECGAPLDESSATASAAARDAGRGRTHRPVLRRRG